MVLENEIKKEENKKEYNVKKKKKKKRMWNMKECYIKKC